MKPVYADTSQCSRCGTFRLPKNIGAIFAPQLECQVCGFKFTPHEKGTVPNAIH
jgi:hypothetical protein